MLLSDKDNVNLIVNIGVYKYINVYRNENTK